MQLCYSKFLIIAFLCVNAFLVLTGTNIAQLDIELGDKLGKTTYCSSKEVTTTSLEEDVYSIEKSNIKQAQKISEPYLENSFVLQDIQLPANQNNYLSINQYTQIVSWIYYASLLSDTPFNKTISPLSITQHEITHTATTITERKNSLTHELKESKSNNTLQNIIKKAYATKGLNQNKNNYLYIDTQIATTNKNTKEENNYLYIDTPETATNNKITQKENDYLYIDAPETTTDKNAQKENNYLYIDTQIATTNKNTQNKNNYLDTTTDKNAKEGNNYLYTNTQIATTDKNTKEGNNYLYINTQIATTDKNAKDKNNYLYIDTPETATINKITQKENNYLLANTVLNNNYLYIDLKKTNNNIQKGSNTIEQNNNDSETTITLKNVICSQNKITYLSSKEVNLESSIQSRTRGIESLGLSTTIQKYNTALENHSILFLNKNEVVSSNNPNHRGHKHTTDKNHTIINQKQFNTFGLNQQTTIYNCGTGITKDTPTTDGRIGQSITKSNRSKIVKQDKITNGHIVNSISTINNNTIIETNSKDIQQKSIGQEYAEQYYFNTTDNISQKVLTDIKASKTKENNSINKGYQTTLKENTVAKTAFAKRKNVSKLSFRDELNENNVTKITFKTSSAQPHTTNNLHLRHIRKMTLQEKITQKSNTDISQIKESHTNSLHLQHMRQTIIANKVACYEENLLAHNDFTYSICQKNALSTLNISDNISNNTKKQVHLRHIRKSNLCILGQFNAIHQAIFSRKTSQFDTHRPIEIAQICKNTSISSLHLYV